MSKNSAPSCMECWAYWCIYRQKTVRRCPEHAGAKSAPPRSKPRAKNARRPVQNSQRLVKFSTPKR